MTKMAELVFQEWGFKLLTMLEVPVSQGVEQMSLIDDAAYLSHKCATKRYI
ncbi:hypothetical protein [Marinobacter sp. F3R11]|uniref:hypothetical protein n=1 Tax=Marinobacter sp. F3R11 TaxID=2267231 RepID=UPI001C9D6B79|nr:hypothetical protein [Marinobacter sp. F3R11]